MNKRLSPVPGHLAYWSLFYIALSLHAGPTNPVFAIDQPATPPATNANAPFDLATFERQRILADAGIALAQDPVTITKFHAPYSQGTPNDYYTMGDSWFPDPSITSGLPYKQHPGQVNPDNFTDDRKCLSQMRENVAALAAAYKITGNNRYASVAAEWLRVFFLDPATRMNPNLTYAQSVPGVAKGRTMGVSDAMPLVEIPKAIEALQSSPNFPSETVTGMKEWCSNYVAWLTDNIGDDVPNLANSHALMYWMEIASLSEFAGDQDKVTEARTQYKTLLLPGQLNSDGSFNHNGKYRSYSTAVTQMDSLATLCQLLSTPEDDLWHFKSSNDHDIHMAMEHMYPFIEDKSRWPSPPESSEDGWPARRVCLLFTGMALNEPKYINLWKRLPADPTQDDVRRFMVITQPILWVK